MTTMLDQVKAVSAWLNSPTRWTKGYTGARYSMLDRVLIRLGFARKARWCIYNESANCWRLGGAYRAYREAEDGAFAYTREDLDAFAQALGFKWIGELEAWNDAPERTYEDVRDRLMRFIDGVPEGVALRHESHL